MHAREANGAGERLESPEWWSGGPGGRFARSRDKEERMVRKKDGGWSPLRSGLRQSSAEQNAVGALARK